MANNLFLHTAEKEHMIFYFSSTGNTAWAAQRLAEATGDRLISIPGNMERTHYTLQTDERIGFCFPVYGWRPPKIVLDFVRRLHIDNARQHYAYMLCTAGDTTGEACKIMSKALEKACVTAHDWFALLMPESYVGLPFMDVDSAENELRKKKEAEDELQQYLPLILQGKDRLAKPPFRNLHEGRWPRTNSRLLGWFFHRYLVSDSRFHVDGMKCKHCGLCARLCPVSDIDCAKGATPHWKGNGRCMTCFSCYHHCPEKAIAFGRQTRHKGQYFYDRTKTADKSKCKT